MRPSVKKIHERAARIAAAGIMDEEEAREMLAIATGRSDGDRVEEDENGRPIRTRRRTIFDRRDGE